MSLLDVNDLNIRYGDQSVLKNVSFSLQAGEAIGLVGESGSGKTQTALAILGLLPRTASVSGSVLLDNTELLGAADQVLDPIRAQRIAMVFQDPAQALNPYVRIGKQLRRILIAHGIADVGTATSSVLKMLERVGLPDPERQFAAYPHQLSGGMRQRVMIASALIAEPDILIADEPTTALDVTVQAQILELLEELREDTALIMITHDLGIVAGTCERTLVLEHGELVEQGPTLSVFNAPVHDHTKTLLRAAPRLDRGSIPEPVDGRTLLSADSVAVSYKEPGRGVLNAVRDADLAVKAGETLAIVGESGSGKSSLVRAILGLVPRSSGEVVFDGEKRDRQLVFQDPVGSLNPQMRVEKIVAEPLTVHAPELSKAERRERVATILAQVGLSDEYLRRFPHELSGGQAQRVAIARALVLRPKLLVCDEAVAALDGSVREQILGLLREVQKETGLAIVFISHDLAVVRSISHRVIVMYLGRVIEVADNEALFATPRHPYTRALIDAVPVPDPTLARAPRVLSGEIPSPFSPPPGCAFHPRCELATAECSAAEPRLKSVGGSRVACIKAAE
jgi:oligopeptide/dipeptide ABC transporter ATP-binding protein